MPVYRLGRSIAFPPPEAAGESGILAFGGDLSVDRLLAAYREGIFPWYDRPPVLWWSPDPRLVLFPDQLAVSRSLRATLRKGRFDIRIDTAFPRVIEACATITRPDQDGTWLNRDMRRAYIALHEAGHAHSIEAWHEGDLAGGLYGVSIGHMFFGESMFSRLSDASKIALVGLASECRSRGIGLIDCQVSTPHLRRMGAREVPRAEFLRHVRKLVNEPVAAGRWTTTLTAGQEPELPHA